MPDPFDQIFQKAGKEDPFAQIMRISPTGPYPEETPVRQGFPELAPGAHPDAVRLAQESQSPRNAVDEILSQSSIGGEQEELQIREQFILQHPDKYNDLKKVEKSVAGEPPEIRKAVLSNFFNTVSAEPLSTAVKMPETIRDTSLPKKTSAPGLLPSMAETPLQEAEGGPEFRKAPEGSKWEQFRSIIRKAIVNEDDSRAKALLIYDLSKVTGLPLNVVEKNYDEIVRSPEITGITPDPSLMESGMLLMQGAVTTGLIMHPLTTAIGVTSFLALDEAENAIISKIKNDPYVFGAGKNISDLLPEDADRTIKETVDIIDFIGKALLIGGTFKKGPKIYEKITKEYVEGYNLPKKIFISPEKVKNIIRGREVKDISTEELDSIKSLGMDGKEWRQAIDKGVVIEVPTEKVIHLRDKPYWAKIKKVFGVEPVDRVISKEAGAKEARPVTEKLEEPELEGRLLKPESEILRGEPVGKPYDPNLTDFGEPRKLPSGERVTGLEVGSPVRVRGIGKTGGIIGHVVKLYKNGRIRVKLPERVDGKQYISADYSDLDILNREGVIAGGKTPPEPAIVPPKLAQAVVSPEKRLEVPPDLKKGVETAGKPDISLIEKEVLEKVQKTKEVEPRGKQLAKGVYKLVPKEEHPEIVKGMFPHFDPESIHVFSRTKKPGAQVLTTESFERLNAFGGIRNISGKRLRMAVDWFLKLTPKERNKVMRESDIWTHGSSSDILNLAKEIKSAKSVKEGLNRYENEMIADVAYALDVPDRYPGQGVTEIVNKFNEAFGLVPETPQKMTLKSEPGYYDLSKAGNTVSGAKAVKIIDLLKKGENISQEFGFGLDNVIIKIPGYDSMYVMVEANVTSLLSPFGSRLHSMRVPKERAFESIVRPESTVKPKPAVEIQKGKAEAKPAKEPWEMTRDEFFENEKARGRHGSSEVPLRRTVGDQHEGVVTEAVKQGKPVPPEVLADYPELQPKKRGLEKLTAEGPLEKGIIEYKGYRIVKRGLNNYDVFNLEGKDVGLNRRSLEKVKASIDRMEEPVKPRGLERLKYKRDIFLEVEKQIDEKFKSDMTDDEILEPEKRLIDVQKLIYDGNEIKPVKNIREQVKLHPDKEQDIKDEIKRYVQFNLGNLKETYRYESVPEGEKFESRLTELWKFANEKISRDELQDRKRFPEFRSIEEIDYKVGLLKSEKAKLQDKLYKFNIRSQEETQRGLFNLTKADQSELFGDKTSSITKAAENIRLRLNEIDSELNNLNQKKSALEKVETGKRTKDLFTKQTKRKYPRKTKKDDYIVIKPKWLETDMPATSLIVGIKVGKDYISELKGIRIGNNKYFNRDILDRNPESKENYDLISWDETSLAYKEKYGKSHISEDGNTLDFDKLLNAVENEISESQTGIFDLPIEQRLLLKEIKQERELSDELTAKIENLEAKLRDMKDEETFNELSKFWDELSSKEKKEIDNLSNDKSIELGFLGFTPQNMKLLYDGLIKTGKFLYKDLPLKLQVQGRKLGVTRENFQRKYKQYAEGTKKFSKAVADWFREVWETMKNFWQRETGFISFGKGKKPKGLNKLKKISYDKFLKKIASSNQNYETIFIQQKRSIGKPTDLLRAIKARYTAKLELQPPEVQVLKSELPEDSPMSANEIKDEFRHIKDVNRFAKEEAVNTVEDIVKSLKNAKDLALFERIVITRDLIATAKEGLAVPNGLSEAELTIELSRLLDSANGDVMKAVDRHFKIMQKHGKELVSRGKIEKPREDYFPHKVLDYYHGMDAISGLRFKQPYRPYTRMREGSDKAIKTDYINTMIEHLTKYYADNKIDDFQVDILNRLDITQRLEDVNKIPDGYSKYQPIQGNYFYTGNRVSNKILEVATEDLFASLEKMQSEGKQLPETVKDLIKAKEALMVGEKKKTYIIPTTMAKQFNQYRKYDIVKGWEKIVHDITMAWKWNVLVLNPKYQSKNLMGDNLNLFFDDSMAFTKHPEAMMMLIGRSRKKFGFKSKEPKALTGKIKRLADESGYKAKTLTGLAEELGVIDSGFTGKEIAEIFVMPEFKRFAKSALETGKMRMKIIPKGLREISTVRENWARLAKFLKDLDRIEKGKYKLAIDERVRNVIRKARGLAEITPHAVKTKTTDVQGLNEIAAAAKASREALLDYGAFTRFEDRWLRRKFVPFWAWLKGNLKMQFRRATKYPINYFTKLGAITYMLYLWNHRDEKAEKYENSIPEWAQFMPHVNIEVKGGYGTVLIDSPWSDAAETLGLTGVKLLLEGESISEAFNRGIEDATGKWGSSFNFIVQEGIGQSFGRDVFTKYRFLPYKKSGESDEAYALRVMQARKSHALENLRFIAALNRIKRIQEQGRGIEEEFLPWRTFPKKYKNANPILRKYQQRKYQQKVYQSQ